MPDCIVRGWDGRINTLSCSPLLSVRLREFRMGFGYTCETFGNGMRPKGGFCLSRGIVIYLTFAGYTVKRVMGIGIIIR